MKKTIVYEAEKILEDFNILKKENLHRPFVIEITGTPEAGKTSVINTLTRFFIRHGWRVFNPPEAAELTKKILRTTYIYNIRTGIYALSDLLDNVYSLDFDLIIFDRALYDAFCWQEFWLREGVITAEIADTNQKFFTQPELLKNIDGCFFVFCQAEEAMRRAAQVALTEKQGETTNLDSIKNLIDIWENCYTAFSKANNAVTMLDTTNMSRQEMGNIILSETIEFMKKRF